MDNHELARHVRIRALALLLAAVAHLGCDASDDADAAAGRGSDAGVSAGSDAGASDRCLPSDELIASAGSCLADEDCPCGSYCALGRCASACRDDSDCEEEDRCGSSRRCEASSLAGRSIAADPRSGGVSLDHAVVTFLSPNHLPALAVLPSGPTTRIRAIAPEGVLVRCGEDESYGRECERQVARETPVQLSLSLSEPGKFSTVTGELLVYGGGHMASASIQSRSLGGVTPAPEGSYKGELQARGGPGGSSNAPPVELHAQVVETGRSRRSIRVIDPDGLFFVGTWGIELRRESGRWSANLTDILRLASGSDRQIEADVGLSAEASEVEVTQRFVSLKLSAQPLGLLSQERQNDKTKLSFSLVLSRVDNLDAGFTFSAPAGRVLRANPFTRTESPSPWELKQASRAPCLDREAREHCAERLLCFDAGAEPTFAETLGFGNGIDHGMAEDVLCDGGSPQTAFRAFSAAVSGPVLLEQCLQDLRRVHAVPRENDPEELMAEASCLAAPRVVGALHLALAATGSPRPAQLSVHLLKQWLQVHSFVLHERVETQRTRSLLGDDSEVLPNTDVSLEETLALAGHGLDLLLHPRIAGRTLALPKEALATPDYRQLYLNGGDAAAPNESQDAPLAVDLAQALVAYVDAGQRLLSRRCGTGAFSNELDVQTTELSRRVFALMDFQRLLAPEFDTTAPETWVARQRDLQGELSVGLKRLHSLLQTCRSGGNPLGIEGVDLPLYFGDASTANARFSAASDYLIGATPGAQGAWVPAAIAQADEAFEAARDAWVDGAERDLGEKRSKADSSRRVEAIQRRYGEQLAALCGQQEGRGTEELLNHALNPESCFVTPGCSPNEDDLAGRIGTSDIAYNLCVMGKLRQHAGPVSGFGDDKLDSLADEFAALTTRTADAADPIFDAQTWVTDTLEVVGDIAVQMRTFGVLNGDDLNAVLGRHYPESALPELGKLNPADAETLLAECDALRSGLSAKRRPTLLPDTCEAAEDCPVGFQCFASECQPEATDPFAGIECYQGSMGEQVLRLRALASEVDIAKSELAELSEHYDIAMESCMTQRLASEARERERVAHSARMSKLSKAKRDVDKVAGVFGTITDMLRVGSSAAAGGPLAIAGAAGAALAGGVAKERAADIETQMAQVTADHEEALERIQTKANETVCFNEATHHLVAARSASLRITQAAQEAAVAVLALDNMKQEVAALQRNGRSEVSNETDRKLAPLAHNPWIDERIDTFERKFRIAQRATYMAVRAVEYEFQACLGQGEDVIGAQTPGDLDAVVDTLLATSSTRGIGGRRPGSGVVVLSLRDDILALSDRSDFGPGTYSRTPQQRLRAMLSSPRHAAFDSDGEYLGQRIRFTLSPVSLAESGGALVSGNACAERLWSVNASIRGADVVAGNGTSFVELGLEKQNTFYSSLCPMACDALGANGRQVSSIRPSRNLFVDPLAGSLSGVGPQTTEASDGLSSARLRAYVDVSRQDLEGQEYEEGESEELAGRGLWGDYSLLIPAAVIQQTKTIKNKSGLVLRKVNDVLLRLEYVSVARR